MVRSIMRMVDVDAEAKTILFESGVKQKYLPPVERNPFGLEIETCGSNTVVNERIRLGFITPVG